MKVNLLPGGVQSLLLAATIYFSSMAACGFKFLEHKLWFLVYKCTNAKTRSSCFASSWEDWTWKHLSARERLLHLKSDSWCVIAHCVGEPVDFVYLEESEMLESSRLKLTGPFGSNHQMCHGKTATSWCWGPQQAASINIFPQDWHCMSF